MGKGCKLIVKLIGKYLVYLAFAAFYGLIGAGVSVLYPEKLVAGFAAGSTVFFVQVLVSHLIHWDQVLEEMEEE